MITIIIICIIYALVSGAFKLIKKPRKNKAVTAKQAAAAARLEENQRRRLDKIEKENQRKKAAQEKKRQQRTQAESDLQFIETQKTLLAPLVLEYRNQAKKARQQVENDNLLNQYGAVKNDIEVRQHQQQYEFYLKRVISLERQLYNLEKKRAAAENILSRD